VFAVRLEGDVLAAALIGGDEPSLGRRREGNPFQIAGEAVFADARDEFSRRGVFGAGAELPDAARLFGDEELPALVIGDRAFALADLPFPYFAPAELAVGVEEDLELVTEAFLGGADEIKPLRLAIVVEATAVVGRRGDRFAERRELPGRRIDFKEPQARAPSSLIDRHEVALAPAQEYAAARVDVAGLGDHDFLNELAVQVVGE